MNPSIIISLVLALWIHPAFATEELPRSQPENVGLSSGRLHRLSDVLEGYVNEGKLAGAVALVARKGKVVYLQAFGQRDREAGSPMREDTIFRIAIPLLADVEGMRP